MPTPARAATALSLTLLTAVAGGATASHAVVAAPRQAATVVRVVDGDTVVIRAAPGPLLRSGSTVTVRLIGVDTPETVDPRLPRDPRTRRLIPQCFGPQATAVTVRSLPVGSRVTIAAERALRDRYGRYLFHVRNRSNVLMSQYLLRYGYGRLSLYSPNTAARPELTAAVTAAARERRGLWAPRPHGCAAPPAAPARPVVYANCDAVKREGKAPLYRGQPGYSEALDRDKDGIACEK